MDGYIVLINNIMWKYNESYSNYQVEYHSYHRDN